MWKNMIKNRATSFCITIEVIEGNYAQKQREKKNSTNHQN